MHLGNYYNWPAAVASNNTEAMQAFTTYTNSICPKNWNLPDNSAYGTLLQAQGVWAGSGSNYDTDGFLKIRTSPLYLVLSGAVGDFLNNGAAALVYFYPSFQRGWYWTSTARIPGISFNLYFYNGSVSPQDENYLGTRAGFSVRCMINTN